MSAQPGTVRVDGFFIPKRRVELALLEQVVEENAVNPHRLRLWNAAGPHRIERCDNPVRVRALRDLLDECDVGSREEDEIENVLGNREDVVDGVDRAVDDLDVLHECRLDNVVLKVWDRSHAAGPILALMPLVKTKRFSLWEISFWLLTLVLAADAVTVLQDPEALRFFGFWLAVAAVVGAIGTVVALLLVWFRNMAGSSRADAGRRLF